MVNNEILDYIKSRRQQGVSDEVIKEDLQKSGWHQEYIESAFNSLTTGAPLPQAPNPTANSRTTVVILALVLFYPIGLVLMWWWMKRWSLWIKILISTISFIILGLAIGSQFLLFSIVNNNNNSINSIPPTPDLNHACSTVYHGICRPQCQLGEAKITNNLAVTDCAKNSLGNPDCCVPPQNPIETASFLFPVENAQLCLNQNYTISWELPNNIQSVKIGLAQPNSDSAIDITDLMPAYTTRNNISENGSYFWVAGQSKSKLPLQPGYGYRILLTGQLQSPANGKAYYWSNNFYLNDCSASQSATQSIPTKTPANNNGVCSTSDGCNLRSPGSEFACNAQGNFDANGSNWCTCNNDCTMTIK